MYTEVTLPRWYGLVSLGVLGFILLLGYFTLRHRDFPRSAKLVALVCLVSSFSAAAFFTYTVGLGHPLRMSGRVDGP